MKTQAYFSNIEAPISPPPSWHLSYDVVIIGLGAAGISAAIEAREAGQQVLIIDRFAGGGASKASGGVVYAGGGTSVQKKTGVEDTVDNMFAYLRKEVGGLIEDKHLRDFCETSPKMIDWLTARGVVFGDTVFKKKTSYPAPEYFLYHSDNSLLPNYMQHAEPAARGHRGWVPIEQGKKAINLGGSIIDPLRAHAENIGVDIFAFTPATQLVFDGKRVSGLQAQKFKTQAQSTQYAKLRQEAERLMSLWPPILPGGKYFYRRAQKKLKAAKALEQQREAITIEAKNGVIICAGGFSFNRKMMAHYAPNYVSGYALGTEGDNGAGIELGLSVGADSVNMNRGTAWRFINPPLSFARGMIVNESGNRFINEMVYGAHLGSAIAEDQDGKAWLILNKQLIRHALKEVSKGQALSFQRDLARLNIWFGSKKAKTIEKLAEKIGLRPAALAKTWQDYCAQYQAKSPDAFGKAGEDIGDLSNGAFYAIDIGIAARLFPCPVMTLGGLNLNQQTGQVLKTDGRVIDGLYAAGRSALGICAQNYISGLSIGDGLYAGRRAAQHITSHTTKRNM